MPKVSVNTSSAPVSSGWSFNGNTVPSEKYIGTNNNFDFPIYTNGVRVITVAKTGYTGFNIALPFASVHAKGLGSTSATFTALFQNSSNNISLQILDDGSVFNLGAGSVPTNAVYGKGALASNIVGSGLSAYGENSLHFSTGIDNSAYGAYSGENITVGYGNAFFGTYSGRHSTSGYSNIAIGYQTMATGNVTGYWNVCLSELAGNSLTSGNNNFLVGYNSGTNITSGVHNIIHGYQSAFNLTTGGLNLFLGIQSGFLATTTSNSVFLGPYSGFYETGSEKLFIDNQQRASEADSRIKSLIYGIFDASTNNQELHFNAKKINLDYIPTGNAGVVSGQLYVDTAANILANGDLIVARKV